jgi:hypothetical protein
MFESDFRAVDAKQFSAFLGARGRDVALPPNRPFYLLIIHRDSAPLSLLCLTIVCFFRRPSVCLNAEMTVLGGSDYDTH